MFFKNKKEKLAEKLFLDSSNMIREILEDDSIQINEPGGTSVIFASYLFIVAGFLGQIETILDMVPVYQKFLIKNGASRDDYDFLTQKVQDSYFAIRKTMIEAQDEVGNDVDVLIFALADTVCKLAKIDRPLFANGVLQEHFIVHLGNAARIIKMI